MKSRGVEAPGDAAGGAGGGAANPPIVPATLTSQPPGSARALALRSGTTWRARPGLPPEGAPRGRAGTGGGAGRGGAGRPPGPRQRRSPGRRGRRARRPPAHRAMAPRARRRRPLPALLTVCALLGPLQVRRPRPLPLPLQLPFPLSLRPRPDSESRSRSLRTEAGARRLLGSREGPGRRGCEASWDPGGDAGGGGKGLRGLDGGATGERVEGCWGQNPGSRDPSTRTRASERPLRGGL